MAYRALGLRKAFSFRVCAVAHQGQNALFPDLGKTLQVNGVTKYRGVIHFKISCVDNNARRRINSQRSCILYAVICLDEFDTKTPQIDRLSEFDHLSSGGAEHIMLLQLMLNQPDCQLGRVDRDIDFPQDIRQSSDMILMSVCNNKPFYLVNVLLQICDVRDNQINSQHVVIRESQAAVHHNNTVFIFKGSNVHADLFEAAQRDNLELTRLIRFQYSVNLHTSSDLCLFFLQTERRAGGQSGFSRFFRILYQYRILQHLLENTGHCMEFCVILYGNKIRFLIAVFGQVFQNAGICLFSVRISHQEVVHSSYPGFLFYKKFFRSAVFCCKAYFFSFHVRSSGIISGRFPKNPNTPAG